MEIGGTDQKFNLLLGRDIQRAYGQPEQAVLTLPILVGTSGEQKMSKSLGNYVGVTDAPEDMYGKTLSLPDQAMGQWYELLLAREEPTDVGPRDAKRALARALVERFHGADASAAAEDHFDRVFVHGGEPEEIAGLEVGAGDDGLVHLPGVLAEAFGLSRSEARRLIAQGSVRLDDVVLSEGDQRPDAVDGRVLRAGKRRFVRLHVRG